MKEDDSADSPGGGGGETVLVCDEGEDVHHGGGGILSPSSSLIGEKYSKSWKRIYITRQIAENAWQTGQVKRVTTLVGHTAWISCLHFDENRIVR